MKAGLVSSSLGTAAAIALVSAACGGCSQLVPYGAGAHASQGEIQTNSVGRDYATVMAALSGVRMGRPESELARVLEPLFARTHTNKLLYHFKDVMPYTNSACVSEWQSSWTEPDGWPQVVFAVFENASKTNLVDALWCQNGDIIPIVDGVYNYRLHSLKAGDSVQKLYADLGYRHCKYYLSFDGRWKVSFLYRAFPWRVFVVEADAAEGRITYIADGTL